MIRRVLVFTILVLCSAFGWAQTDGMSYQAVVIGPAISEIPGADIGENVLQNAAITIRLQLLMKMVP